MSRQPLQKFNLDRRNTMSKYDDQIRATEEFNDRQIRSLEQQGVEILSSVVPGGKLHQIIHNPTQEGIDEG
jgi:hypothetical protein